MNGLPAAHLACLQVKNSWLCCCRPGSSVGGANWEQTCALNGPIRCGGAQSLDPCRLRWAGYGSSTLLSGLSPYVRTFLAAGIEF